MHKTLLKVYENAFYIWSSIHKQDCFIGKLLSLKRVPFIFWKNVHLHAHERATCIKRSNVVFTSR